MKKEPTISVIIPIFKVRPDILTEAINSVLSQTFQDFEIVLVDNNAPSDVKETIDKFQREHWPVIRAFHEPEQGLCSARNRGIVESRGEFIALLDSDDIMLPTKLEVQLDTALKNPTASIVATSYSPIDNMTGQLVPNYVVGGESSRKVLEDQIKNLLRQTMAERNPDGFSLSFPSTMLFRKKTAQRIGLFDPRMNPQMGEDDVFLFRMFMEGDIVSIQAPLTLYRTGGGSDSSKFRNNPSLFMLQSNKAYFIMWETLKEKGIPSLKPFKGLASFHLKTYGKSLIRFRNGLPISRHFFFRAWKNNLLDREFFVLFLKSLFPKILIPRLFWFDDYFSESIKDDEFKNRVKKVFHVPPQWVV